ncbi:MAG: hypothetical protein SGJ16_13890 [Nitrospirota bacterium]|nr:hypothetical protein [Nitrospirota bacterium]
MNSWLQTRRFTCPRCGQQYLHDQAYRHDLFDCSNRRPMVMTMVMDLRHHDVSCEGLLR